MTEDTATPSNQKPMPKLMAELYIILIGLAFGFGVQGLVESLSWDVFFRFAALFAILLIWLHSQLSVADLESYKIVKSWSASLLDHYLDTISAVLLVSASSLLDKPKAFYILVIATFAVDVLVEFLNLGKTGESEETRKLYKRDRELSWTWIIINSITIALLLIVVFCTRLNDQYVSFIMLTVVMIGNVIDYSKCRDFYFGPGKHQ